MAGGWTNDQLDELVAPSGTPFLPGNNVVGFGTTLPAELTAAGYLNAIVFYASDWNPAAVTSSVKFRFIAATSAGLVIGYGAAANPSISQTAVVVPTEIIQTPGTTSGLAVQNTSGNQMFLIGQDVNGNAYFRVKDSSGSIRVEVIATGVAGSSSATQNFYDNNGFNRIQLTTVDGASGLTEIAVTDGNLVQRILLATENSVGNSSLTLNNGAGTQVGGFITNSTLMNLVVGSGTLFQTFANNFITSNLPIIKESWSSISGALTTGWFEDSLRPVQAKMNSDDTVQLRGWARKNTNPANAETWFNAFSATYRPSTTRQFLLATPGRIYNSTQSVEFRNDGTSVVFDPGALPGSIALDHVRYAANNTP